MFKLAFLIPHYNHSEKIELLVQKLSEFGCEILIVDDGSSAPHKEKVKLVQNAHLLFLDQNGGKGYATKHGFAWLYERGFTHALQIDADMQHDLSMLGEFITCAKNSPNALICGFPVYGADVPKSRLYGRKITNFWTSINTLGGDLKDAMCGVRVYPLAQTMQILPKCYANRMDFDIDILYLLYKLGLLIIWLKIGVKYDKNGTSHFKMLFDNLRISCVHARHFFALPKLIVQKIFLRQASE